MSRINWKSFAWRSSVVHPCFILTFFSFGVDAFHFKFSIFEKRGQVQVHNSELVWCLWAEQPQRQLQDFLSVPAAGASEMLSVVSAWIWQPSGSNYMLRHSIQWNRTTVCVYLWFCLLLALCCSPATRPHCLCCCLIWPQSNDRELCLGLKLENVMT